MDNNNEKIIVHISGFPPPIGGVTIFLQRLKYYTDLFGENKICYVDVTGINVKEKERKGIHCVRRSGVLFYLLREKPAYIVFHSNNAAHIMLNLIFRHKHKFIYFAHGESILKEKNRHGWRNRILAKAECIVCPTDNIYSGVKEIFPQTPVKKIPFVILPNELQPLNEPRLDMLREKVDFVFSAYASSFLKYKGSSIYGLDLLIEALYKLRKDGYNCGIVLLIGDISDKNEFYNYKSRIEELNLMNYFTILDQPIDEACRLYANTDAYLRPTNTDANAFSIYEALYLGTPVLASDAVPRPEGCLIFRNRNIDSFVGRIKYLMDNYDEIKESIKNLEITGNEKELIDFFHNIGKKSEEKIFHKIENRA